MKLSIRIGLVIGGISLIVSSLVASLSYYVQLKQATTRSELLVSQLAQSAKRTSAIAAYLNDTELAQEIVAGLVANELIAKASIHYIENKVEAGTDSTKSETPSIRIALINPFIDDEPIGFLSVYTNNKFIQTQASSTSLQSALSMVSLSVIIALIVGFYVRKKLTLPLKQLSREVSKIDTRSPQDMRPLQFTYNKRDEIGGLSEKTNALISALRSQFQSEKALRESTEELQKRFRLIFEQATAGIALLKANGYVTTANPAFDKLFGASTQNKNLADFFESPLLFKKQITILANEPEVRQVDIDLVCKIGNESRYFHCLFSSIAESRLNSRIESESLIEVIVYDVTQRKNEEEKARFEADHDSLTGLLNRRAGIQQLEELTAKANANASPCALMMIDLDKFKPINDNHGHEAGDQVLMEISRHVSHVVSHHDACIVRWGGDEFLLGAIVDSKEAASELAHNILQCIHQDIEIDSNLSVNVGASIGAVLFTGSEHPSFDIEMLINQADEAMYKVKDHGRNNVLIEEVINKAPQGNVEIH